MFKSRRNIPGMFGPNGIYAALADLATDAADSALLNGKADSAFLQTSGNQSATGTKTFSTGLKGTEKVVIPLDQPTSLENGDIWIA